MNLIICVVFHDNGDIVYDILSSITKITESILVSHVFMLDTGSRKAPLPIVNPGDYKNFQLLLFRDSLNRGYAQGNNILLRKASAVSKHSDLIIVCNPDISLDVDTILSLMKIHVSTPLVFAVSPRPSSSLKQLKHNSLTNFAKYSRIRFMSTRSRLINVGVKPCLETIFLPGSFMMLKASLVTEKALFNEDYFMYLEEIELIYRMYRLGHGSLISMTDGYLHNEGQNVYHPRKTYYTTRNSVALFKTLPLRSMPAFFIGRFLKPFLFLGSWFIVSQDYPNIKASFHGLHDGLKGKMGFQPYYHQ